MNTYKTNPRSRDTEEMRAVREAVERANEEAAANWYDPEWRREMGAEITEEVAFGFKHENLLSLMSQVETVGLADRVTISEVRGLKAFWVSVGGNIEQSTLRRDVMEITRDFVGFHVSELEEKMEANFGPTSADIISRAIEVMDATINQRVLRTFQAAIPDASSPYYVHGGGLSLAALNSMITDVQEASLLDEVVIVGRAGMTNQIMDAIQNQTTFAPATVEDIIQRGILGQYRGATIVKLKNYLDEHDVPFIPGNELWVVGKDASKGAFWGGLTAKEWSELGGWYWHYLGRRAFGFACYRANRLRRFVDDNKAA